MALQQKRTQVWDTPINSVNAVYAFLNGNMQVLQAAADSPAKLSVDGKRLETPNASAGMGYVKATMTGARPQHLAAHLQFAVVQQFALDA